MKTFCIALFLLAGCYNPTLGKIGFFCHPDDKPACPEGSTCQLSGSDYRCVATTTGSALEVIIPKTGSPYNGVRIEPTFASEADCPDNGVEPNDTLVRAVIGLDPVPDVDQPKTPTFAICPKAARSQTGLHDQDLFQIDTTKYGNLTLTMMADVSYDIVGGDLDVAILNNTGGIVASDGSAVPNGCITATVSPGVYYVAVVGAQQSDINNYQLRIRTFTTPVACGDIP